MKNTKRSFYISIDNETGRRRKIWYDLGKSQVLGGIRAQPKRNNQGKGGMKRVGYGAGATA